METVQKRTFHHRRWCPLAVQQSERTARGVPGRTMVAIDGISDSRQVGAFCQVVTSASTPDQNVIGEMASDLVAFFFTGSQHLAQESNVFVVPGVAIGNRGAVSECRDLITIIPPRHDSGIFRRVVSQPPVCLAIVVQLDNRAVAQSGLDDDCWIRKVRRESPAVMSKVDAKNVSRQHQNGSQGSFCEDGFAGGQRTIECRLQRIETIGIIVLRIVIVVCGITRLLWFLGFRSLLKGFRGSAADVFSRDDRSLVALGPLPEAPRNHFPGGNATQCTADGSGEQDQPNHLVGKKVRRRRIHQ
mmetsp:Transcript_25412/g.55838  ORF Transcript_25412/g.55838 Transcript_25412/m.55838 type:complete len:301 (+) Transcript_25412:849-1751(+)